MKYQSELVEVSDKKAQLELGYVICKSCGSLIATLPTNRVKRYYGECSECAEGCDKDTEGAKEFD
ncbi:GapA-binding peptide SR1P [Paenibacillus arenilitoris]|uniref:GapA-binding peptide SR1P n=1 Tax=Paenibacillus arenilitoris TaxID=2772299 RepID=A0A927H5L5_9BACL|nr:GapA-binding peptide SR1P [Paenibacillus arenilitoris]MBD2868547.1 GapA-binding peptide SR1P [Paenibacillus arenilitoris]